MEVGVADSVRTMINNVADNDSDDLRSAGDWNGEGYDGVVVRWDDDATDRYEKFIDDERVKIASS